ncbi:asparagine synthase (glutamine-hydrolyzing), partial [Patescibacteria group bacterium]|nr:asparagine synthase (glutamine-hydrolyzing) [Patescibacteria group bacterium]
AFCIWDEARRRLFLARDRLGKKPLYYSCAKDFFIFASEIKAILCDKRIRREINLEAIGHYLSLQYIPEPQTILKGVASLLPAHTLTVSDGRARPNRYWDISFIPKLTLSKKEVVRELRDRILEAVKSRLISDVPLGAFLSGGIDSSLIVGLMAGLDNRPVKTFSIGFGEERYSELRYAKKVADHFKTDHHEFVVEPKAAEILSEMVYFLDQPLADPAALPTYYLAKLTREHVTVALNGDGGDETFAGYQRYLADRMANLYRVIPSFLRNGLLGLIDLFPVSVDTPEERDILGALRRLHQAALMPKEASLLRWGSYFSREMKEAIYSDWLKKELAQADTCQILIDSFKQAKARSFLDKTLYVDEHNYLSGDLLPKVDRMSMACGLEARSPFLDYQLMEFVAKIPSDLKIRGLSLKYILKRMAADLLPREILSRPKQGFGVPVGAWFRGELKEMAGDHLFSSSFQNRGYFKKEAIERLLEEHQKGRANHGKRIWALLILELWHKRFIDQHEG